MKKIVIFGATGNLSIKKLLPSLNKIYKNDFSTILYSRNLEKDSFLNLLKSKKFSDNFLKSLILLKGEYLNISSLLNYVDDNTVYYLSLPLEVQIPLIKNIIKIPHNFILIEKPYASSYKNFEENNIFLHNKLLFIDHYLTSKFCLSLPLILEKNINLKLFINKNTIDSVEAYFKESILADNRPYFKKTGIISDVIKNHLIEIISVILSTKNRHEMREKIIKNFEVNINKSIYGQYKGYEEGKGLYNKETFACINGNLNMDEWKNVPFILIAGKALNEKKTEIQFNIRKDSFCKALGLLKDSKYIESYLNKKEKAIGMKLKYNFKENCNILLEIKFKNKIEEHILISEEEINFFDSEGYEFIFRSIIKNKEFPNISYKEAYEQLRIFDDIIKIPKSFFIYDVGVFLPLECLEFLKNNLN